MTSPDVPPPAAHGGRKPTVALVTGPPGSGKSTLARTLGQDLSCPVISRDEICDGIAHNLGRGDKDLVGWLAFDAFFRVLALLASCEVTVVADAAFQDLRWRLGLRSVLPLAEVKIIRCTVDPAIARQRVAERRLERQGAPRTQRDPVSTRGAQPASADIPPFEPPSLPLPSLAVATADGYDPGLDEIAAFVASR